MRLCCYVITVYFHTSELVCVHIFHITIDLAHRPDRRIDVSASGKNQVVCVFSHMCSCHFNVFRASAQLSSAPAKYFLSVASQGQAEGPSVQYRAYRRTASQPRHAQSTPKVAPTGSISARRRSARKENANLVGINRRNTCDSCATRTRSHTP